MRNPYQYFNYHLDMKMYFLCFKNIFADMSIYANRGNIIGTLVEDTCHQLARCNGKEGAKSASPILNLTAIISRIFKPDNLTIARMSLKVVSCFQFICLQPGCKKLIAVWLQALKIIFSVIFVIFLSILYTFSFL